MALGFSPDSLIVNRQTYSILDWLGDIGGLIDALFLLGQMLILPIATFALNTRIMSSLFRYRATDRDSSNEKDSHEVSNLNLSNRSKLIRKYFDSKDLDDEDLLRRLKRDF